jgi:hypothetical protein
VSVTQVHLEREEDRRDVASLWPKEHLMPSLLLRYKVRSRDALFVCSTKSLYAHAYRVETPPDVPPSSSAIRSGHYRPRPVTLCAWLPDADSAPYHPCSSAYKVRS